MYLDLHDRILFYNLYFDLLYCTNEKRKIVEHFGDGRFPTCVDSRDVYQVREALFANPKWIDEYLHSFGGDFTEEERDIVVSWRDNFVKGRFYVMKHLAKYSVLMAAGDESSAMLYGITGLNQPFADLYDKSLLPLAIDAVLLPFKGRIIYDSLVSSSNVRIDPNMRMHLNEEYRASKEKSGIIVSLPFGGSATSGASRATPKKDAAKAMQKYDVRFCEIAGAITGFCESELSDEFNEVCLFVLEKLRRKRPTPLNEGDANTWACGIVYAVCSNNFVFDRSQTFHMSAQGIADGFGLSKSDAQSKAAEINKALKITYFSPEYVIASLQEQANLLHSKLLELTDTAEDMRRFFE